MTVGDGQVVKELHLQDLVRPQQGRLLALDIISDAEVQRCCIMLDDREGHGFIAADVLGVELVRGSVAPTEAHNGTRWANKSRRF